MTSICIKFCKSQMSAGCFKKKYLIQNFRIHFFQKTIFSFPPLWLVAVRKIPLPFLFVCYSLLGISIFWWAKPARDLLHRLWTFKGHSCLSTAALQRSPFFAHIIPVTDLLYKFIILSHKYYVRNIIRNNIFCVTECSFYKIHLNY